MKKYWELIKNTGLFALASMASKLIAFFFLPLYTYYLTTEEYAVIDLAHVMQALLWPILSVSIAEALLRFALDRKNDIEEVLSTALAIVFPGIILFVIVYPNITVGNAIDEYKIQFVLYYIFVSLNSLLGVFARTVDKVKLIVINSTVSCFAIAALNVLFLTVMRMHATGYFAAMIIGNIISVVSYIVCTKIYKYISFAKINKHLCKEMVAFSIPLIPNAVFWWVNSSLDKIYLTAMTTLAEVGLYSAAGKIPSLLNTVTSIFQQAWSISAIKEIDQDDKGEFFTNIFRVYTLLIGGCTLGLVIIAQPLGLFLLSNEFYTAWKIVPVLVMAFYYASLNIYYGSVFTAKKKTNVIFFTTGLGAIVNIILNYVMILCWGAIGAAVATCLSNLVVWCCRANFVRKMIKLNSAIIEEIMCQVLIGCAVINAITINNYWISVILIVFFVLLNKRTIALGYKLIDEKVKRK